MSTIGIDARLIGQTGVGVYIRNLLHFLGQEKIDDLQFYIYLLPDDIEKITFSSKNFIKKAADFSWHSLSEQIGFYRQLMNDNLDLMHFTYFSYPILYKKPFVATVHDLTPYLFKTGLASTKNPILYNFKYQVFRRVLTTQIRSAKAIITPTHTVKQEILEHFGTELAQKIFAIYEGIDVGLSKLAPSNNLSEKFNDDFFVSIANFYPHKNIESLVRAYKKVTSDAKLVLVGPAGFFADRLQDLIDELALNSRVTIFKSSSASDRIFFYKNAKALISPSLSEGFGLTLAEAAYFDLPIIASDIPVFNEIWDDQFVKFNPKDADSIAGAINSFLKDKPKFDYKKILAKLSFQKMSHETLKIYEAI